MDAYKLDDAPRLTANTILFTVMPRFDTGCPAPVIDDNIELLERRPGFFAMLSRFRERDWKGRFTEQLIAHCEL